MLVQIYEVTSAEEASALTKLHVDHIGVLVGKGEFPREQSITWGCTPRRPDRPGRRWATSRRRSHMGLISAAFNLNRRLKGET